MPDVNKDEVAEKLARALEATSTPETAEETPTKEASVEGDLKKEGEDTEEGGENRVPQKRFNEVNTALKTSREAEAVTQATLTETQDKLVKMHELLEARTVDVNTLNEIKSFVNDPDMKDHVIAIDNKLKGIETIKEEVESGETTPEDALKQTQELLEAAQEEMRDTQADVKSDALIAKADGIAERLLQGLPEEYNAEDIGVISDLFHEKVNWDEAIKRPDDLAAILTEGFQATVDRYGVPRGALFNAQEVEVLTPEATETPQTPEEELTELMDLPWGGVKTSEVNGKTVSTPEMSDDDFKALMAQGIRLAHAEKK